MVYDSLFHTGMFSGAASRHKPLNPDSIGTLKHFLTSWSYSAHLLVKLPRLLDDNAHSRQVTTSSRRCHESKKTRARSAHDEVAVFSLSLVMSSQG